MTDMMIDQLPTKRRCDECDLCCTAVSVPAIGQRWNGSPTVPDFEKPASARCQYLAGSPGHSCTVYSDRPRTCREFACLWRASDTLLPESMYPARVGFVVAMNGVFGEFPTIITVHPDPDHPDAWNKNHHRREFARLAHAFNAIVVVGEASLAQLIFTPRGHTFSREEYPELFKNDGKRVGLPEYEFLPHIPSKEEIVMLLFGAAMT